MNAASRMEIYAKLTKSTRHWWTHMDGTCLIDACCSRKSCSRRRPTLSLRHSSPSECRADDPCEQSAKKAKFKISQSQEISKTVTRSIRSQSSSKKRQRKRKKSKKSTQETLASSNEPRGQLTAEDKEIKHRKQPRFPGEPSWGFSSRNDEAEIGWTKNSNYIANDGLEIALSRERETKASAEWFRGKSNHREKFEGICVSWVIGASTRGMGAIMLEMLWPSPKQS